MKISRASKSNPTNGAPAPAPTAMLEWCPPGKRPRLHEQPTPSWAEVIDAYVHPVKVAALEVLRWVGGPLSAREIWLVGVGEADYGTVSYHVKSLVDLGLLRHTASSSTRGSAENFYVLMRRDETAA